MKKLIVPVLALTATTAGLTFCATRSLGGPTPPVVLPPGNQRYQPTRLEWAAVAMNALWGNQDIPGGTRPIRYLFKEGGDGIHLTCQITYDDETPKPEINQATRLVEIQVDDFAKTRGWKWLQVKFDYVAIPTLHPKGANSSGQ